MAQSVKLESPFTAEALKIKKNQKTKKTNYDEFNVARIGETLISV